MEEKSDEEFKEGGQNPIQPARSFETKGLVGREEMSVKDTEDGPHKRSSVERADNMFSF